MDTNSAIKVEIVTALERLGAHPYLLGMVNSWGDTLSDDEVLALLKEWNAGEVAPEAVEAEVN